MTDNRIANYRAVSRQDANHTSWNARLLADAPKLQCEQRRELRRFDDDSISGSKCRRQLLGFARDRRIPWRDRGHNTHGIVNGHCGIFATCGGESVRKSVTASGKVAEDAR